MSVNNEISGSPPVRGLDRVMWISVGTTEREIAPRKVVPFAAVTRAIQGARAFLTLVKPETSLMVMISAGFACLIASDSINLIVLTHAVPGTGLVAASAASLNQFMERALDGNVRRTSKRPLPAGKLTVRAGFVFGIFLSVAGTIYLIYFVNMLTALLGLFTLLSYLFIYTPLKRKTRRKRMLD